MASLVMIDSCIFLEIILEQPLNSKCEEKIYSLQRQNFQMCISMEILYEIMTRIEEDIEDEIENLNPTLISMSNKIKLERFNRHMHDLKKLLTNCKVIYENYNYEEIRKNCNCLRVENHLRGDRDKTNIALGICNNCVQFVTKDRKIYDETEKIREISNNKLKICFIY